MLAEKIKALPAKKNIVAVLSAVNPDLAKLVTVAALFCVAF